MAIVRFEDVVATVEDYLASNWPDPDVALRLTAREAVASTATAGHDPDYTAELQWIGPTTHQETRITEQWLDFDLRVLCRARDNDPLKALEMATLFSELLRGTVMNTTDRSDGTTETGGWIHFLEAVTLPPIREETGQTLAVCQAAAWAHTG